MVRKVIGLDTIDTPRPCRLHILCRISRGDQHAFRSGGDEIDEGEELMDEDGG